MTKLDRLDGEDLLARLRARGLTRIPWDTRSVRECFRAIFREHLSTLWPVGDFLPLHSLGRYDEVLFLLLLESYDTPETGRSHRPVGEGFDVENDLSVLAFDLEQRSQGKDDERRIGVQIRDAKKRRADALHNLTTDRMLDLIGIHPERNESELDVLQIATGPGGIRLVELRSSLSFDREGLRMEHCLRSTLHYFDEAERGDIRILSLRDAQDRPQVTIELNLRANREQHDFVRQAQGPRNGPFPKDTDCDWLRDQIEGLMEGSRDAMQSRWLSRFHPVKMSEILTPQQWALQECDRKLAMETQAVQHGAPLDAPRVRAILRTGQAMFATWNALDLFAWKIIDHPRQESYPSIVTRQRFELLPRFVDGDILLCCFFRDVEGDIVEQIEAHTWSELDAIFRMPRSLLG